MIEEYYKWEWKLEMRMRMRMKMRNEKWEQSYKLTEKDFFDKLSN